jgi:glycine/D-amino acid oxidase-like deaminating enzyme
VMLGTVDHPNRLVEAVGTADAAALLRFSARSIALLDALDLPWKRGGVHAAWNEAEVRDLDASLPLLHALDLGSDSLSAADLEAGWGFLRPVPGSLAALRSPWGGWLEPRAVLDRLAAQAQAAGARCFTGHPVLALDGQQRLVFADGRRLSADVVVVASGWQARLLDAAFEDTLYPVRHQRQRRGPGSVTLPSSLSTQGSYLLCRPDAAGGLVCAGARWATQHLEAGETDEDRPSPKVSAAQDRFLSDRLAPVAGGPPVETQASISAYSCDGLPIVGPLPGRPALLACLGWNGRPWSWALAAAEDIAQGLLTGRSDLPRRLSPRRLLA